MTMKNFLNPQIRGTISLFILLTGLITLMVPTEIAAQDLVLDHKFTANVTDAAGEVYVSKIQADGKVMVGGDFRFANGVAKNALVR